GMDIRLPLHIEQTYYPEIPLADTAPFLRAPHGQSPNTACQTASAASAAVSARMIRGPRLTGRTKAEALIAARSSESKPPSGPVSTLQAVDDFFKRSSAAAMGSASPPSSQNTRRRSRGQCLRRASKETGSRTSGIDNRPDCSAASIALALRRSRFTRLAI